MGTNSLEIGLAATDGQMIPMVFVPYGNQSDKSQGCGDRVPASTLRLFYLLWRSCAGNRIDACDIILVVFIR